MSHFSGAFYGGKNCLEKMHLDLLGLVSTLKKYSKKNHEVCCFIFILTLSNTEIAKRKHPR